MGRVFCSWLSLLIINGGRTTLKNAKILIMMTAFGGKKSIFYNLEYWKYLLVCHQLDIMHIKKNVCENIYGTQFHIPGKTKDGLKSKNDLVEMKIRDECTNFFKKNRCIILVTTCYTLIRDGKIRFCKVLKSIRVLARYSSNIKKILCQ